MRVCLNLLENNISTGHNKEALELFEGVPLDSQSRMQVVSIYMAMQDFESAENECRAILDLDPTFRDAQVTLADIMSWRGDSEPGIVFYEQLLAEDPTDNRTRRRLADLYLWSEQFETSLELYQTLLDENMEQPDAWGGYLDAANGAENLGPRQRETFVELHGMLGQQETPDPVLMVRLAAVLRRMGELESSVTLLERAVDVWPTDDRAARLQMADVLHEIGDYERADKYYRTLLGTAEEDAERIREQRSSGEEVRPRRVR